jgi:hypothetical protein
MERTTAPKKNSNSEVSCSLSPRLKSQLTTQKMELHIHLAPTNSLTGLLLNISNFLDTSLLAEVPFTSVPLYIIQLKPSEISIGEHKVQSQVLKTKVNADHAGHFLPLVLLKEPTCLAANPIKALHYSQSNN